MVIYKAISRVTQETYYFRVIKPLTDTDYRLTSDMKLEGINKGDVVNVTLEATRMNNQGDGIGSIFYNFIETKTSTK